MTPEFEAKLDRLNKLRKNAMESNAFSDAAKEHEKAIQQTDSHSPATTKKTKKKGPKSLAEIYKPHTHEETH
ncbi:hypothetical protein AB4559_08260 [Vibrio sp. 10N.222.51.C8]|jgi:hypothetical protein|uniref:Uncharacterized protein n=2 Tax=Vibrio cyclitrophicus TaxID=47951 RepID=A0A7Z1S4P0_9VIBR|nr:hypothetical protein [Vibrio cyclitrophicus]PMP18534.1 hypothetical protein BCS91_24275 [Vibrio cyclitrophicus]PMP33138.1 hypothetical protein BCS90_00010 [Vibrio cyclitrophicus]